MIQNSKVFFKNAHNFPINKKLTITYKESQTQHTMFDSDINAIKVCINFYSFVILVFQTGKPTPPSNVFVVCKTTSATIFWKPEFDGGDNQTFEVKYWKTSQVTTLLSTTPVTDLAGQSVIEQLLSGFNYSFVLQTSNIYGTSNATLLTCETDVKGKYMIYPHMKTNKDIW